MIELRGHKIPVKTLTFSPDGERLASSDLYAVCMWDLRAGQLLWRQETEYSDKLAFSPDGKWLASNGLKPGLYNARTGGPAAFRLHQSEHDEVGWSVFTQDGRRLVGLSLNDVDHPVIYDWDVKSGNVRRELPIREDAVGYFAIDPAGKQICVAGKGEVFLLDLKTFRQRIPRTLSPRFDPAALDWSSDGRLIAVARGPLVSILNARTLVEITEFKLQPRYFLDVAFHPGGRFLATVGKDELVRMWDTASWRQERAYGWGVGGLRCVAFAPDGLRGACGGDKGRIVLWDVDL